MSLLEMSYAILPSERPSRWRRLFALLPAARTPELPSVLSPHMMRDLGLSPADSAAAHGALRWDAPRHWRA